MDFLNCDEVKLLAKVADLIEFLVISGVVGEDTDVEGGNKDHLAG